MTGRPAPPPSPEADLASGPRDAHWPPARLWPWLWSGAFVALFAILAALAGTIGTLPGDRWIAVQLQRLDGQPWRTIWHLGNAFGTSHWVVWIALAGLVTAIACRQWRDAVFLVAVAVLRVAAMPLKGIVQSPRPTAQQVHILEPVEGYGFPSGHTLTATVLFGAIAVLMVRHLAGRWRGMPGLAVGIWVLGVATTGFARVWSGAHWPSDVLGSALLGSAIVIVAANLPVRAAPAPAGQRGGPSDAERGGRGDRGRASRPPQ